MNQARIKPFAPQLRKLTDDELNQELRRRRAARSQVTRPHSTDAKRSPSDEPPSPASIFRSYANLELSPGAPQGQVEQAYARLLDRYQPERFEGNAELHQTAQRLAHGLEQAYRTLLRHFERSEPGPEKPDPAK